MIEMVLNLDLIDTLTLGSFPICLSCNSIFCDACSALRGVNPSQNRNPQGLALFENLGWEHLFRGWVGATYPWRYINCIFISFNIGI